MYVDHLKKVIVRMADNFDKTHDINTIDQSKDAETILNRRRLIKKS